MNVFSKYSARHIIRQIAGNQYTLLLVLVASLAQFRSLAQTPDPGLMGTHTVLKQEYNLGDVAYYPPAGAMWTHSMEVRGSVTYPSDLSNGPFPVVLFLHGRHETCYNISNPSMTSGSSWPCPTGWAPIVSYEGYDYLARTMASHGYIVISVSANCINSYDAGSADQGMSARGYLVQHHLDLWNTWNTSSTGPFGSTFVGKLDMKNIGTMGHSRGGEGVVYNALLNRSLGSPYGIKAVLTLAPVDFYRKVLNGIPLMDVAPYCDGDVSDLEGVHFYDDARYSDTTDQAPKHLVEFMGANHDFFNTVWTPGSYIAGGADDWADYGYSPTDPHCGTTMPTRFDTTKQKNALNAYLPAFFRLYLGHETQFAQILMVDNITPPASSTLTTSDVYVSWHAGSHYRLDVDREDSLSDAGFNTLHGAVTTGGLVSSGVCGGGTCCAGSEPNCGLSSISGQEPHSGSSGSVFGMSQMALHWNDTSDFYQNAVPAAFENLTNYEAIQFRATVNYTVATSDLDFTVQLIDSLGDTSGQAVTSYSKALFLERGTESGDLPKDVFNTVKIPLSAFTGVNLAKIRYVRFKFNRVAAGAVLVGDMTFVQPICGKFAGAFHDTVMRIGTTYKAVFTDSSTANISDSLGYHWNFGDASSGTADTSTLKNPNHTYSAAGTYSVCETVTTYRKGGIVCSDTACKVITLLRLGADQLPDDRISIVPNPAKNFVRVTGAEKGDVLVLVNLYGQVVFTAAINDPVIYLPPNLATGIYTAIVNTTGGRAIKKLLIER